jgi:hypothetical protein
MQVTVSVHTTSQGFITSYIVIKVPTVVSDSSERSHWLAFFATQMSCVGNECTDYKKVIIISNVNASRLKSCGRLKVKMSYFEPFFTLVN